MRSIDGRLSKLEKQLGITHSGPRYFLILIRAGQEFGPADEAYIERLDETGLLPTRGFRLVNLIHTSNTETAK